MYDISDMQGIWFLESPLKWEQYSGSWEGEEEAFSLPFALAFTSPVKNNKIKIDNPHAVSQSVWPFSIHCSVLPLPLLLLLLLPLFVYQSRSPFSTFFSFSQSAWFLKQVDRKMDGWMDMKTFLRKGDSSIALVTTCNIDLARWATILLFSSQ